MTTAKTLRLGLFASALLFTSAVGAQEPNGDAPADEPPTTPVPEVSPAALGSASPPG